MTVLLRFIYHTFHETDKKKKKKTMLFQKVQTEVPAYTAGGSVKARMNIAK